MAPAVGIDHDRVPAFVVAAMDDEPGRAGLSHFPESDLLLALHAITGRRSTVHGQDSEDHMDAPGKQTSC